MARKFKVDQEVEKINFLGAKIQSLQKVSYFWRENSNLLKSRKIANYFIFGAKIQS